MKSNWAALNQDALAAHVDFLVDHPGLDFHSDEDAEKVNNELVQFVLRHSFRSALAADLLHALDSEEQAATRRVHPDRFGAPPSVNKAKKLLANTHLAALYDVARIKEAAHSNKKKLTDEIVDADGQVRVSASSAAARRPSFDSMFCFALLCSPRPSTTSECAQ